MTLTHSQSTSGNSNSDVLVHRSSNSRNSGSGGGLRRNNCDRSQIPKNSSSQYHKPTGDSERKPRTLSSTMPIASACSYNSEMASFDQGLKVDNDAKSKDAYLDERLYKNAPETVDPSIVSRGSTSLSRRYTRSALYLLRSDTRSRCRPKCASKLQLLYIWKTNNNNQQNGGNSNNSSNSLNAVEMGSSSLSSPRMGSVTRLQNNHDLQSNVSGGISSSHNSNQKSYLDHRSISSSHLMPAFAKRRIGNSMQSNSGSSSAGGQSLSISTESMKAHISSKNNNQKQFLSPQRRHLSSNQLSNSLDVDRELDQEHDGGRDRERGRDHESDVNLNASGSSSSNARERRIGSGRLLPRDANWDYRSEKDSNLSSASSVSMAFEKDVSSHSPATGNNTQRLPSNSGANLSSSHQRLDFARSPTSKDRISGGKNSSEYRSEARYESRRSFARGEYERDNRTDNSNYVRRFMSDLINQNSSNNFASKSNSVGQNHNEHRRRNHRNDEPEWFSSGPTSQHDTIELRGFDENEDSNSNSSGSVGENGKHNKKSKQNTRKNRPNNLQTHSLDELSAVDNMSESAETGNGNERDNSAACNEETRTTSITPSSPKVSAKSDTNNNSRKPKNCIQMENKPFSEGADKSIFNANSKNKTDDIDVIAQSNANNKRTNNSPVVKVTASQIQEKNGFNFDAFLNADPISNLIMGEQNSGENTVGSRFSRWFVKQGDSLIINSDSRKSSLAEEMVSMINESQIMSQNEGEAPVVAESTNTNQSNTLMEFLQRGRINPPTGTSEVKASVGSIPSVEELEARMRKIGEQNITLSREQPVPNMYDNMNNPLNQLLSNSGLHHQHQHQQQQQQQQQKHTPHFVMKNEIQAAPILKSTAESQQHLHTNNPHQLAPPQTQDMEAFKKLLEQITPNALSTVKVPTQSNIQQLAPPQQTQMHRLPPHVNMLTAIGAIAQPTPTHLIKNDELAKFIQQQQQHQRRQQHVMPVTHQTQLNQGPANEAPIAQAMFLAPQQRLDAQLLLQGISRGEVAPSSLGHTIGNPSASPRAKEVLTSVLRETSRDTSPNVIMSVPQIMSPVLGQSHCATIIPVPPSPNIMPNPQQIAFNHPPQPGSQQPHPSSGTNAGGLQQRIPSPRELQYHTQSIMQNALIKKKLEEQQENFRRRQEIQKLQMQMQLKPVQPHLEVNEFGVLIGSPQQQHPQNQMHQKKISQQQQIIQGQQQHRHVNSPTPLAFTPTSVLRKMTAEKESGNSFHTSASPASSSTAGTGTVNTSPLISTMATANAGASNSNPNKPIHSLLMHYQHQQTNSSQNQPRMILGVGSNSQQQQQQQGVAIISGPPMQQQHHPDNSRINTTLRNNQIKWSGTIMNQISITKPMGRPILKGSLTQSVAPPTNSGLNIINQQQSQTAAQPPQMAFASKIEFQQIQQQRSAGNNQPPHPQKQQQQQQSISPQQQSQNILMTQLYQQRAALQRAQQYQIHHIHQQQQQINIIQNNGNRPDRTGSNGNTSQSSCGNIIHYQRDGGLSPTSNQLARWFSPELLAQASAGKLPPLNINQALSLEEFEKSIQHSSTAVNN